MTALLRRLRDAGEDGATLVEFALVSVVAFMLMFTGADFALIVLGNSVGSNAARDGARVGIINYIDADTTGSTNNSLILAAVQKHLVNNVRNASITVKCLRGDTQAQVTCNTSTSGVDLTRGDLIEVKATWQHKGYSPFMPSTTHSSAARMVIGGKPDLTTATTASTSSTSTSSTSSSSTTTTTVAKYIVSSLQMKDVNTDGAVDQVVATFSGSGSLANCTNTSMWTLANVPSGGSLQSVSVSSNVATLTINGSHEEHGGGIFHGGLHAHRILHRCQQLQRLPALGRRRARSAVHGRHQ